jgi:hypothetical protein
LCHEAIRTLFDSPDPSDTQIVADHADHADLVAIV